MLRRLLTAAVAALALVLSVDVPVAGELPTQHPPEAALVPTFDGRPPIVVAVATARPVVALTFDDGPDPRWTPSVLGALQAAGVRATFFVTGEQARAHPDLLHAIVAAGSEIANHTDTHPKMDPLDAAQVASEVRNASMAIGAAGVPQLPYFRPPRGRYGPATLDGVADTGLSSVGWTVCLERWLRRGGPAIGAWAAADAVRPGGILLSHDGGIPDRRATVEALPTFLQRLQARGLEVVALSELLGLGPPVLARPGTDPRDQPLLRTGVLEPR